MECEWLVSKAVRVHLEQAGILIGRFLRRAAAAMGDRLLESEGEWALGESFGGAVCCKPGVGIFMLSEGRGLWRLLLCP